MVAAALKAADDRSTALATKRDGWADAVAGTEWTLPAAGKETLEQVGAGLEELSVAISERRTDEATAKAADLTLLVRDLGQECADSREAYLAAVARAKTAIAGGSDATMSALSTALDKVAALATDAWPTDLRAQLQIADDLVGDWTRDVLPALVEVVDSRADPGSGRGRGDPRCPRDRWSRPSSCPAPLTSLAELITKAASAEAGAAPAGADPAPAPARADPHAGHPAERCDLPAQGGPEAVRRRCPEHRGRVAGHCGDDRGARRRRHRVGLGGGPGQMDGDPTRSSRFSRGPSPPT